MTHEDTTTKEPKTPGPINRQGLYAYASKYSQEAIDHIVDIMRTTRNDSLRLGAAKALLDKSLPDLKAMEVGGVSGAPIQVQLYAGNGFIPQSPTFTTSSTAGAILEAAAIQSVGVAPTSPEDNDSNNGDSQASTS